MKNPYAQKTELIFAVISKQCSQLSCQREVMLIAESHTVFQTAAPEPRGAETKWEAV
jgi:hypothetical protein